MKQPKIKIQKTSFDKFLEWLGISGLLLLIMLPAYYFPQLPDIIPTHFGINGQPDAFGSKYQLWILPAVGIVLFTGLSILARFPHVFNYPGKITPENAAEKYRMAAQLIRVLNVFLVFVFVYITFTAIRTAQGKQEGLGNWFIILFVLLISFIMGFFLYQLMKERS